MSKRERHDEFMRRWKDDGGPITHIECPHCRERIEIPRVSNTDVMAECPSCGELYFQMTDGSGNARASVPGVPA